MRYDFDREIDRNNTNSLKYDFRREENKPDDVFPMWVADMDFRCCDEILKDMHEKTDHGIFGYSQHDERYFHAVQKWYEKHFDMRLKQEWLLITPGVVFALATAVKTLTDENDYVLINDPVYYPFKNVVKNNKRKIISSDLILKDGRYEIDFVDFENKIRDYRVKLFLLCSPHNPIGRVWRRHELDRIIEICRKHDVFIVSDEIHSDFVWNDNHTCLLKYEAYQNNIILCTAPSKTFNLAGLQVSNIFIPGPEVRKKFRREIWSTGYDLINVMGLVACQSAYEKGQDWLDRLKEYLIDNINYVDTFLKERLPKIKLIYPEGTYLLWLDFNGLKLSDDEIEELMLHEAKLWLDHGKMFGDAGAGFQRLNIALPREKLKCALENLEKAYKDY